MISSNAFTAVPVQQTGHIRKGPLLQAVVVALALAVCLLAPKANGDMLLVPIDGKAATALDLLASSDPALVGAGRIPGSLVIRAPLGIPLWALLQHGIIPLSAPEILW